MKIEKKILKKATKKEIEELKILFLKKYPDVKTELNYKTLYELLICVMLSAQCTDKRVNIITPKLFKKYPNIEKLSKANIEIIKECIQTCSFFNRKAEHLIKMSKYVIEFYNGEIPLDRDELIKLAGVGRKTANVIMSEFVGANFMAVDTHVFRVAYRLGLSGSKSVEQTEKDLVSHFKTDLNRLHQAMIIFGRYNCKAINPLCNECFLFSFCKFKETK